MDARMGTDPHGIRYSDDDKAVALQVWAFLADRSPRKTSDILQERHGIAIPAKRISEWARTADWHTEAQALYRDQAPDLFDQAKFTLTAAGPGAARYLHDVTHKGPDGAYIEATPDRVRMQAAFGILDRIGFVPMSRREGGEHSPIPRLPASTAFDPGDLSHLSLDELRDLAAGALDVTTIA